MRVQMLLAVCALISACGGGKPQRAGGDPGSEPAAGGSPEQDSDATPEDCPDPKNEGIHYVAASASECPAPEEFSCAGGQTGFYNACGCGCIDHDALGCTVNTPNIHFFSRDPADCAEPASCGLNQLAFDNSCGCGCIDQ